MSTCETRQKQTKSSCKRKMKTKLIMCWESFKKIRHRWAILEIKKRAISRNQTSLMIKYNNLWSTI